MSERERQIPYDVTYMWNLKCGTNESIYKTATDSQIQRTDLWVPRGRQGEGEDLEFGVNGCKVSCVGWMNSTVLLSSTGSCIQYPMINHNGKNINVYICITE